MSDFKEKIENALSNFEDAGFKYSIMETLYARNQIIDRTVSIGETSRPSSNLYNTLKKIQNNDEVSFGRAYQISIFDFGRPLSSYKKWVWYNDEIKLAIRRITEDFENVEIHKSTTATVIVFKLDELTLFNIKSLVDICKLFNSRNLGCNLSPRFKDGKIKLFLIKQSNSYNVDIVKNEIENNFEIEKSNFENRDIPQGQGPILAELRVDRIKMGEKIFSVYEK